MERTKQGEISWVDLVAKDLDAQTRFYEGLFGWTHEDLPVDGGSIYRMFKLDGKTVAGAAQMSPEMAATGMPSMWNTYVAVNDVDSIATKAAQLGGKVVMPVTQVMSEGRMVGIEDTTGATVFFWEAGEHLGAQTYDEPGALMWDDLDTREPAKAADFYAKLLGWDVQSAEGSQMPYWVVNVDGRQEAGIMPMPDTIPAEVPAHWLVYFGVQDADVAAHKAESLGAKAEMAEPMDVGATIFDVLEDPMGATFAIMTPMTGM